MKRVYLLLSMITFLLGANNFLQSSESANLAPSAPFHFSQYPSLSDLAIPPATNQGNNAASLYSESSCYRSGWSAPVDVPCTQPIAIPSAMQRGHHRNLSKSLTETDICMAKIAALEAQLSSAQQELLQTHRHHKETRTIETQTDNQSEHQKLALIILAKIANLESICQKHQEEYADLFKRHMQLKSSASAPSGFSSLIPGASRRAAARISQKTKNFDDKTHQLGTSQQEVIDAQAITIQWKLEEVIAALNAVEQKINTMHTEALAEIIKKAKK